MHFLLTLIFLLLAASLPCTTTAQQNELLNFSAEFAEKFLANHEAAGPGLSLHTVALSGVQLFELPEGKLASPALLVFNAGRWQEVTQGHPLLDGRDVIDAAGLVLAPGLIDHHVHLAEFMMNPATLFPANGVTAIVNLSGSDALLQLARDPRLAGLPLPVIKTTGPFLQRGDSNDAGTACGIAAEHKASGFSGIKFYQEDMSGEDFSTFLVCSATLEIPIYGHLPEGIDVARLVGSPFIIAHAEELLGTYWEEQADWLSNPDSRRQAAKELAEGGTALIPNLGLYKRIIDMQDEAAYRALLDQPEMALMPEIIRQLYGPGNPYRSHGDDADTRVNRARRLQRNYEALEAFTREFCHFGGRIFPGSDAPNPMAIYGKSLIDEMLALDAAGVPTLQILRFASGERSPHDLEGGWVLLDTSPLVSLSAYAEPRAVILDDTYWPQGSIGLKQRE